MAESPERIILTISSGEKLNSALEKEKTDSLPVRIELILNILQLVVLLTLAIFESRCSSEQAPTRGSPVKECQLEAEKVSIKKILDFDSKIMSFIAGNIPF